MLCRLNGTDIFAAAPEQYDVINKWRGQYHIDRDLNLDRTPQMTLAFIIGKRTSSLPFYAITIIGKPLKQWDQRIVVFTLVHDRVVVERL